MNELAKKLKEKGVKSEIVFIKKEFSEYMNQR